MRYIFNWPQKEGNDLAPWYTVLRRIVGLPFVYTGLTLTFIGGTIGWGLDYARDWLYNQSR